jgi:hypothetical protein
VGAVSGFLAKVAGDRMGGERPGAPRAFGAAVVVGAAVAVIAYRVLRREPS